MCARDIHTLHQVELATGSPPVFVDLDFASGSFEFDWNSLQTQLDHGMGALLVTNPGNPSTVVYSKEVLERLVKMTESAGCVLVLDEVYWYGNLNHFLGTALTRYCLLVTWYGRVLSIHLFKKSFIPMSSRVVAFQRTSPHSLGEWATLSLIQTPCLL